MRDSMEGLTEHGTGKDHRTEADTMTTVSPFQE